MTGLFLFAALSACGDDAPAPEAAPEPAPAPAAEPEPAPEPEKPAFDAKTAYETVCGTCHGVGGAGDGVAGGALEPKPANFTDAGFWTDERTDEHLAKAIKEGGGAVGKSPLMAPYGGQYDDEQIAALVAHIKTFKPAE